MKSFYLAGAASLAFLLSACGSGSDTSNETASKETPVDAEKGGGNESAHADEGVVTLTADQIAAAGVQIGRPIVGGAGTIELPAIIEGDPQGTQVVSAAIAGRVVADRKSTRLNSSHRL